MSVDDQILAEELLVAYEILRDEQKAAHAVARAVAQLPYAATRRLANRLRTESAGRARESYRSLAGKRELLRYLLFKELEKIEVEEEIAGRLLSPAAQIRCQLKHLVMTVLYRNSFHAAVAAMQILREYRAKDLLRVYNDVISSRAEHKDEAACSHAKGMLIRGLEQRFRGRVQLRRQGPALELNWRRATPAEVDLVERVLPLLLPPVSAPPEASSKDAPRVSPILEESFAEMNRMHRFLHPDSFRSLVSSILPRREDEDAEHPLRVLDTALPGPDGPESDSTGGLHAAPHFDLDRVKDLVAEYRKRRWLLDARSVTIRADSIDRGMLDLRNPRCEIQLEEGAGLVEVIGDDADHEPIELASYLLTYDSPKLEYWDVDIPGIGQVCIRFDYNEDESVHATFALRPERSTSQQCVGEQQNATKRHATSRVQEHLLTHTSLGNPHRQSVFGQFDSGCAKTSIVSVGFLRQLLMRTPGWFQRTSLSVRLFELLSRHDNWSGSLQSRALHQQREEAPTLTAEHPDRVSPGTATDRVVSRKIDELVARQARVFDDFLNRAKVDGIVPGNIPCIHEPHARLSSLFGALSIAVGISELLGIWFSSHLAGSFGEPITAAALVLLGAATLVTANMWWRYRWSVRLYRNYHQLEHRIALLRERLAHGTSLEGASSAELLGDQNSPKHLPVDWRGLALARTLGTLLRSPAVFDHTGATSWIVNSMSEAELRQLLNELGENRNRRRIASAFISNQPIESVQQLAGVLGEALELPRLVLQFVEHDMNQALRKR